MKTPALFLIMIVGCAMNLATHGQVPKAKETEMERIEREVLGNVPIRFWGRVLDQDGQPLPGAKVKIDTRTTVLRGLASATRNGIDHHLITDDQGFFTLANAKGDALGIQSIEKEGYELSTKPKRSYGYYAVANPFTPDPQNPVVFRMWKKRGAEPMFFQDKRIQIPYDGTSVVFDLIKGEQVQNPDQPGDIRVTLSRTPTNIAPGQRNFDWQATVEAIDGGLKETQDEFTYLAPQDGYQPKIILGAAASDPKWTGDRKVTFYLHNRGGQNYGRVTLEFNAGWWNQPKTGFGFQSYINPSGSRVLEYDSTKRIIPGKKIPK